jgi:hypothetical protein
MLSGKDELAGGMRMAQVRRIKKYLYLVQIALTLIIPIFVILAEGRASLVPFYLPINSFIYFVLLMVLIIAVESFFFKILEMRLIRSNSTRYYVAKQAIRRGLVVVIISAVVVFLLWAPFVSKAIEDSFAAKGRINNTGGQAATAYATFYDRDPLGLSSVNHITVNANSGVARVYVVSEKNFNHSKDNISLLVQYRINIYDYEANPALSIEIKNLPYGKYYIVLDTVESTATSIDYSVHPALSPVFLSYVPFFALMFIVAYGAWIAYLIPMKRRYSSGAIYT